MATQIEYPTYTEDGKITVKQGLKRPAKIIIESHTAGFFDEEIQIVFPHIVCDTETRKPVNAPEQGLSIIQFADLDEFTCSNGVTRVQVLQWFAELYDAKNSGELDSVKEDNVD